MMKNTYSLQHQQWYGKVWININESWIRSDIMIFSEYSGICVPSIFNKAVEDSLVKCRNEATAISKRNVCLKFQDAPISEVLNQALHSTIIASLFVTAW